MAAACWRSYALVAVQFACLSYLALTGPLVATGALVLVEIAGGLLGLWAMWTMRQSKLNIAPDVRHGARLVTDGPYRWVRHPMYSAVLLVALAVVLAHPTPARWGALLVLGVDLLVKLHYEERLLAAAFAEYPTYRAATKRLLPLIY